jgi:short-subunit dehydrogenase
MPKVVIIGGSSEIGNAISNELMRRNLNKFQSIVKLSTSLNIEGVVSWNPVSLEDVEDGLRKICFEVDDVVIVAIGTLGGLVKQNQLEDLSHIAKMYFVNQLIPILALSYVTEKLESLGGGKVILLSSTAAFPVLDSNFMYGSAKYELDTYARFLQRSKSLRHVEICVVRFGFIRTKLNKGRTPTPFSRTAEEVAKIVVEHLNKDLVWAPKIFKYISFVLCHMPQLKFVANKIVENSRK